MSISIELILLLIIGLFLLIWIIRFNAKHSNKNSKFNNNLQVTLANLADGQQQLFGGLKSVSDTQSLGNANIINHVESRLTEMQKSVSENLNGSAYKTAKSLGELQQRLVTIDVAQNNLDTLQESFVLIV